MATPSLAMIPSAYADSKVYSVLPNNGDGDFTFNRDSSATRVGPNGLIQTVGYFGSELVTNGSFDTDSDWTFSGGGVSISGGKLNFVNTTREAEQSISIVNGKTYRVEYKVSNYSTGTVRVELGTALGTARNTNGIYVEEIISAGSSIVQIDALTTFTGSIDYISIKEVTGDQPRLNYDISNGVVQSCPSLLLEPARTNLITYSEDFSQWTASNLTVTDNNAISPDGTLNASKLTAVSGSATKRIQETGFSTTSTERCYSIFVKTDDIKAIQLLHSGDLQGFARFDLVDYTVGSVGSKTTATIQNYGNGWYKCTAIFNSTNAFGSSLYVYFSDSAIGSYGGTSSQVGDLFIYGAQYEEGSYPTSYIPTNGSSQTRAAETCDDAGNAATFNSTEGVLYAEFKPIALDSYWKRITLSDGTSTNRIILGIDNANNLTATVFDGSNQAVLGGSYSGIENMQKYALKFKENDFALWINGVEVNTDSSGSTFPINTLDNLSFEDGNGGLDFYGSCKDIRVYNEALTDAQLQTLTTL